MEQPAPASRTLSHGLRRAAAGAMALVALASLAPGAVASTKSELESARSRLIALEHEITAEQAQLDQRAAQVEALQRHLNRLAAHVSVATSRYEQLQQRAMAVRQKLRQARDRYHAVRDRLNARVRTSYEEGPGIEIGFLLGSKSLADLSDRMEFVAGITRSDADLSAQVQNRANDLHGQTVDLGRLLAKQVRLLDELAAQQKELDREFVTQQRLYDEKRALVSDLSRKRTELGSLVDRLASKLKQEELVRARALAAAQAASVGFAASGPGPFYRCPVDGPHAYGDSFGAPRYAGGFHLHAGNDIMAPEGTPVVAPFDGTLEQDPNTLGGNAIIEHGAQGWIYGAHLSAYGATGAVTTGTVIGYVGNTGDAAGGPTHLHFEWHPSGIPAHPYVSVYGNTVIDTAIDPYPYLNEVC